MTGKEGGFWGDCDPSNPKNYRTRSSILVTYEGCRFLIDTSPDFRSQFLTHKISGIDAVLYTHAHADHIHGIDELRPLYFARGHQSIPCYAAPKVLDLLQNNFSYLFKEGDLKIYPKVLEPFPLTPGTNSIEGIEVTIFAQEHGPQTSLGFRFGDFAYSTDFKGLSEKALQSLRGVKIWVVDCLARDEKPTHCHLELTLEWIKKVAPQKAYLTHMNQTLDYETLKAELPETIEPAYDGLRIPF